MGFAAGDSTLSANQLPFDKKGDARAVRCARDREGGQNHEINYFHYYHQFGGVNVQAILHCMV